MVPLGELPPVTVRDIFDRWLFAQTEITIPEFNRLPPKVALDLALSFMGATTPGLALLPAPIDRTTTKVRP